MSQQSFEEKSLKENANTLSILYVEEHAGTRLKLSTLLKKYFLKVDILSDSKEITSTFKRKFYDLIIVGTIENSISTCKEIKYIAYKKPIIIVSNTRDSQKLINFINIGISGYISAPLINNDVINILSKVVREISDSNIIYFQDQENLQITPQNILLIEEEIASPQDKIKTLEEQFIEFTPISAQEFDDIYPTDLLTVGDKLLEITEMINLTINRFVNSPSQDTAIPVIYAFQEFSNILLCINEFSNISLSTQKFAEIFSSLDYAKSYKECYDIILVISVGLIKWCESVFSNQDAVDIHYLDKSLLADVMMVESLLLGTNQEAEEEIEFF